MASVDDIAVENFRKYLRINTAHPNINYDETVKFLKKQAEELNLPVKILTFAPKKPIVLITLFGTEPNLSSILLNSHTDVVPAFENSWKHPPFEAHMDATGNIYARGAQDMKCVGIIYLETIRRLQKENIRLRRTLHISFVPDEEIGGTEGMNLFVKSEEFKTLNIGFSFDEGVITPEDSFPLFFAEKTNWQIHVHCLGTPGHGCSLHSNTPGEKLRHIMNKFFDFREENIKKMEKSSLSANDVTSINLTKIYGGVQENVVPEKLTAVFDLRISVDENLVEFQEKLENWCTEAGPDVYIEYKQKFKHGGVSKIDDSNPFWTAMKTATNKMNLKISPVICPGTTDSRYIRDLDIPAFGFTPINNTPTLLHAHNEYVNKNLFLKGIEIFYNIIKEVANV